MTEPLHVIVVGGGIAGLCLAQGLRQAGVSVAVYERDRSRTDRLDGYRIHLNPAGSRALKACLPPPVWDSFVATAGEPGGLGFLTEQLPPRCAGSSSRTPNGCRPRPSVPDCGSR